MLKKLCAMIVVFALLIPAIKAYPDGRTIGDANNDGETEYLNDIDYWENAIIQGDTNAIYRVDTTDEVQDSNTSDISDKRISGESPEKIIYQVVEDYDEVSNAYYDYEYDWISGGGYVVRPTDTPTPTEPEEITDTPSPTEPEEVTDIPSPTEPEEITDTPSPTEPEEITDTPSPTEPEEITNSPSPTEPEEPDITPEITEIPEPTPTPKPIPRPDPSGKVYIIPEEKTPTKVTYDIDLEVGRYARMVPTEKINTTKKSSDTNIINDPRDAVDSFGGVYEARANNPGDATITFYNQSKNFTEEWNVHVYCRPLDFEKTQYVVEKKAGKDAYITLFLKYFEYEFEYAYAFEWETSDKTVAYQAGGDKLSTFCRFCITKPGVTIITVKDKYGRSSQCALVVKDADIANSEPETTPTDDPDSPDVSDKLWTPGDIDDDQNITPKDVTLLRRHLAGGWDVTINEKAADVDGDGSITPKDVTILRRYLAGGWGVELAGKKE